MRAYGYDLVNSADRDEPGLKYGTLLNGVLKYLILDQRSREKRIHDFIQETVARMSTLPDCGRSRPAARNPCVGMRRDTHQLVQFCVLNDIWFHGRRSLVEYSRIIIQLGHMSWGETSACEFCSHHVDLIEGLIEQPKDACEKVPGICYDCFLKNEYHGPHSTCRLRKKEEKEEKKVEASREAEMN